MYEINIQILEERYGLSIDRIAQIPEEDLTPAPFRDYFRRTAEFLLQMDRVRRQPAENGAGRLTVQQLRDQNRAMYEDVLPDHYGRSYADPAYAQEQLGDTLGRALSFLYVQLRGIIGWACDGLTEEIVLHQELFLEVYQMFCQEIPSYRRLQQTLYWFLSDNSDILVTGYVRRTLVPEENHAMMILRESDLSDLSYLYKYGEYVTDEALALAAYLNTFRDEEIDRMAETCTREYRLAAQENAGGARTIHIRYPLGLERAVRSVIRQFGEMGIRPVIFRTALSAVNRCDAPSVWSGYSGGNADLPYESDHREDAALFLDKRFVQRRSAVMRKAYEDLRNEAAAQIGTVVLQYAGQKPFGQELAGGTEHTEAGQELARGKEQTAAGQEPARSTEHTEAGQEAARRALPYRLSDRQKELDKEMKRESALIRAGYLTGSEYSFVICDFRGKCPDKG